MAPLPAARTIRTPAETPGEQRRSTTDAFDHTISGLLTKRADVLDRLLRLRDAIADAEGDILALDRVLAMVGYTGELEAVPPRSPAQEVPFGRGQMMRAILNAMREVGEPVPARRIAEGVARALTPGDDGPMPVNAVLTRVSKSLGRLKRDGVAVNTPDGYGGVRWSLAP